MTSPATQPTESPRRLTRSSEDHLIAGVAGGLGRYFGLDPVLFRIAFGVSIFFGGLGLLAYIALVAFLPSDDGGPSWIERRSRTTTIVASVALAVAAVSFLGPPAFLLGPGLLALAILGLLAVLLYRAFGGGRGDDAAQVIARGTLVLLVLIAALGAATGVGFVAAIGGGVAVAVIAIVAGVTLIAAGLLGGPRWLILPVIVLVLPLAVVSAADIDLRGGVGERDYRPTSVASLQPEYRVGAGQMTIDLRSLDLPARTDVKVVVGVGEAVVRVPEGACVSTDAQIGVGQADLPEGVGHGGLDVAVADAASPSGRPEVHVKADIGVGHLQIVRDDFGAAGAPVCS
jgi:phage shock protein PspC (stress-responsive transcriptional regulator)